MKATCPTFPVPVTGASAPPAASPSEPTPVLPSCWPGSTAASLDGIDERRSLLGEQARISGASAAMLVSDLSTYMAATSLPFHLIL
jgi:hypothetical protein